MSLENNSGITLYPLVCGCVMEWDGDRIYTALACKNHGKEPRSQEQEIGGTT